MKTKCIIDIKQEKSDNTISITITGFPLMSKFVFNAFAASLKSFLEIFSEQVNKHRGESWLNS